jgi:hypothetical protein
MATQQRSSCLRALYKGERPADKLVPSKKGRKRQLAYQLKKQKWSPSPWWAMFDCGIKMTVGCCTLAKNEKW